MAIDDPRAIKFANEKARVLADQMTSAYLSCRQFMLQWDAQSVGEVIPDAPDLVEDGSTKDGRTRISGSDINALLAQARQFCAEYEKGGNALLLSMMKLAVNGAAKI